MTLLQSYFNIKPKSACSLAAEAVIGRYRNLPCIIDASACGAEASYDAEALFGGTWSVSNRSVAGFLQPGRSSKSFHPILISQLYLYSSSITHLYLLHGPA
jgi:hypothetical protein